MIYPPILPLIWLLICPIYLATSCDSKFLAGQNGQPRQNNKSVVELQGIIRKLEKDIEKYKANYEKIRQDDEMLIAECRSMYNAASDELNRTKEQYVELSKELTTFKERYKNLSIEFAKLKEGPTEHRQANFSYYDTPQADTRFVKETKPAETTNASSFFPRIFSDQSVNENRKTDCARKADQLNLIGDERKQYINGCLQR